MKKTIAIIGVDGTGKSTLIKSLQNKLGDKVVTMYMGSVRYEDDRIANILNKPNLSFVEAIKVTFLIYFCFWKRYKKAIGSGKLVLFDRYVQEKYLNEGGKYKLINILLYKYLFPKTAHSVYLYCPVEKSLERKNDIPDPELFTQMKNRYDQYFLNLNNCICLSSEEHDIESLADNVYKKILELYNDKL